MMSTAKPSASLVRLAWNKPGSTDLPDTEPNEETRAPRDPADAVIHRRSLSESQKQLR